MTETNSSRQIAVAAIWFLLSTIITWWFIKSGALLYHFDTQKMILSCAVAGAKWGMQIVAAFLLLKEKRWVFIRGIAFTCFVGSCILLPYCLGALSGIQGANGFQLSLALSVGSMLLLYYRNVRKSGVSVRWYFFWLACLAVAIGLQLTVVFHLF